MSASREKKKRFEERSDGTEKRQVRANEDFKSKKRKKLITGIAAVVVVVLIILGVVFNSNLFYTGMTAVKVGHENFTTADFNYEYFNTFYNTYTEFYNTYGSYTALFLDTSTALDKQYYSDDVTWDQYFEEQAFTQLKQMTILNDMADAEGWELSAAQKAEVDANIENLKTTAANNNYSDYRAYIRALYGRGLTEKRLRNLLEKSYRATYYSNYLANKWMSAYTDAELDEYYDSVRKDYDLVSFMVFDSSATVDEESEIDTATAMAAAKDVANEVAAARDQATFAEAAYRFAPEEDKEDYEDEDYCLRRLAAPAGISNENWRQWLTDPARVSGDTTVLEYSSGYYVLLFLERNANDYNLANFRGITINVETDENTGEITEATRAAAQETVNAILEAYETDPTEENFAALANQYDTSGDDLEGGLHQNVIMGELASTEVEDFIFGKNAQVGEVKTIYDDGKYYITYVLESGERYDRFIAKNLKQRDDYQAAIESVSEDYPVTTTFAFNFAKKR